MPGIEPGAAGWEARMIHPPPPQLFKEFIDKIFYIAPVLQSIPWDKVDIQVLVIEVHYVGKIFDNEDETVESYLVKQGYKLLQNLGINQIFVKNNFEVHQLKKPFVRRFDEVV